jgi:hypothetical protein
MAKKKVEGYCHICSEFVSLTFEHIPPDAAFNNERVRKPEFKDYVDKGPDYTSPHAKFEQRGAGDYTLCGYCNNSTGSWYVPSYVDMAYQAAVLLHKGKGNLSLYYPFRLFPLRFIKQVIAMFCSANNPGFIVKNPELRKFLLNKETMYIDPKINIYAYLTTSNFSRQSGISSVITDNRIKLFSEICFAPFGFIMTLDSYPPDDRLVDISYFARYNYNHFDIFHLKLPVLPVNFYLPGDFRTREEIMKAYKENTSQNVV